MRRDLARVGAPVQHAEPLPAPYWTRLEDVRVPGTADRIDLVLIGPSGVHVVIDRPGQPHAPSVVPETDADLERAAQRAAVAARAVADLLPPRYHHVVTSEVCLPGLSEAGVTVGTVFAASPDVLRHAWRHRPRVVSTSEAAVVARLLRHGLEPFPVEPAAGRDAWWRRWPRGWVIGGAAAITGLAAGGAAALVTTDLPALLGLR